MRHFSHFVAANRVHRGGLGARKRGRPSGAAPVPLALRVAADHCALHAATQHSVEWLVAVKTPPSADRRGWRLAPDSLRAGSDAGYGRNGPRLRENGFCTAWASCGNRSRWRRSSGSTRILSRRCALPSVTQAEWKNQQEKQPERKAASSDCHDRHCFLSATAPACIGPDREVSCAHGWSARISSQSKNF
jgi:hypothetical protein